METNKPLIDLFCEECGNPFQYHRKKKFCDPCSDIRQKRHYQEFLDRGKKGLIKYERAGKRQYTRKVKEVLAQKYKQLKPSPDQKELANIVGVGISWIGTVKDFGNGRAHVNSIMIKTLRFKLSCHDKINLRTALLDILQIIVDNPGEQDVQKYNEFFSDEFKERYGDGFEILQ